MIQSVGIVLFSQEKPALLNAPVMEAVWLLSGTLGIQGVWVISVCATFSKLWVLFVTLVLMVVGKRSAHPGFPLICGVFTGRLVLKVVLRQVGMLIIDNVYVNTKY